MSIEQRQYKEMFDEIKLSEDRKAKIEEAMRMDTGSKRKFSVAKLAVLTVCMIAMLSCVCVAAPIVVGTVEEMLNEKGDVITYESRSERIPNKVTVDTKEIIMVVNGEPFKWEIDASQFADEKGNVDVEKVAENVASAYLEYHEKNFKDSGKSHAGMLLDYDIDGEGNLYIEAWTDEDPRNASAWTFMMDGGPWCLVVPENAIFAEDIELIDCGKGGKGIPLPAGFKKDDILFFDFTYNGEEYIVAASGEHWVEIIKKEENK